MRRKSILPKTLAVFLSLALGLPVHPEPVEGYALRQSGLEENSAKEKFLKEIGHSLPAAGAEESQRVPFELSQLAQWSQIDNELWVVDTKTIPNGLLRDFIDWLDELGLDDVGVIGGLPRDSLLGSSPKDTDFLVKVTLPPDLQVEFEKDVGRLTPILLDQKYKLKYRADKVLHEVAEKMKISPKRLFRLQEKFRAEGLEYSFSSIIVGRYLIDASHQSTFTFNQIAMDRHGRVYMPPRRLGIQHLKEGLIAILPPEGQGPRPGIGLKAIIQAIRYKHQYQFQVEPNTQRGLLNAARAQHIGQRPSKFRRIWWAAKGTLWEIRQAVQDPSLGGAHLRAARRLVSNVLWDSWMEDVPVRWLTSLMDVVPDPQAALAELNELGALDKLRGLGVNVDEVIRVQLEKRNLPPPAGGAEEGLVITDFDGSVTVSGRADVSDLSRAAIADYLKAGEVRYEILTARDEQTTKKRLGYEKLQKDLPAGKGSRIEVYGRYGSRLLMPLIYKRMGIKIGRFLTRDELKLGLQSVADPNGFLVGFRVGQILVPEKTPQLQSENPDMEIWKLGDFRLYVSKDVPVQEQVFAMITVPRKMDDRADPRRQIAQALSSYFPGAIFTFGGPDTINMSYVDKWDLIQHRVKTLGIPWDRVAYLGDDAAPSSPDRESLQKIVHRGGQGVLLGKPYPRLSRKILRSAKPGPEGHDLFLRLQTERLLVPTPDPSAAGAEEGLVKLKAQEASRGFFAKATVEALTHFVQYVQLHQPEDAEHYRQTMRQAQGHAVELRDLWKKYRDPAVLGLDLGEIATMVKFAEVFSEEEAASFQEAKEWALGALFPSEGPRAHRRAYWDVNLPDPEPMSLDRISDLFLARVDQAWQSGEPSGDRRKSLLGSFQEGLQTILSHAQAVGSIVKINSVQRARAILIASGVGKERIASKYVHEIAEMVLIEEMALGVRKDSDWIATAFEMLYLAHRHALELDEIRDPQKALGPGGVPVIQKTPYYVEAFQEARQIPLDGISASHAVQIERISDETQKKAELESKEDQGRMRHYLLGAALGGLAYAVAKQARAQKGEPENEEEALRLAGKYVLAAAAAASSGSLERMVQAADQALLGDQPATAGAEEGPVTREIRKELRSDWRGFPKRTQLKLLEVYLDSMSKYSFVREGKDKWWIHLHAVPRKEVDSGFMVELIREGDSITGIGDVLLEPLGWKAMVPLDFRAIPSRLARLRVNQKIRAFVMDDPETKSELEFLLKRVRGSGSPPYRLFRSVTPGETDLYAMENLDEVSPAGILTKTYSLEKTQGAVDFRLLGDNPAVLLENELVKRVDGYRPAIQTPGIVVIGGELAQRFLGLQVLVGIEPNIVIAWDPAETAALLAERNVTHATYFGGAGEGQPFLNAARLLGIQVIAQTLDNSEFRVLLPKILVALGVPEELAAAGAEEFVDGLEALGEAA